MTECTVLLYADDLKMYYPVRSASDCQHLQNFLSTFYAWCHVNCLAINVSKCIVISFTRSSTPIRFTYCIYAKPLTQSETVKKLGVLLDNKLCLD